MFAPASLGEAEIHKSAQGFPEWWPRSPVKYVVPNLDRFDSQRIRLEETGNPHPGSNDV